MICKKCGNEFILEPDKPGLANVCLSCTESPDASFKSPEAIAAHQKAVKDADRANLQNRIKADREKAQRAAMGFEVVRRIGGEVPEHDQE